MRTTSLCVFRHVGAIAFTSRFAAAACITLVALATTRPSAYADIRYVAEEKLEPGPKEKPNPNMKPVVFTVSVKDGNERIEQTVQVGSQTLKYVTLNLCQTRQTVRMNPALKLYTVGPLDRDTFGPAATPGMLTPSQAVPVRPAKGAPSTGRVVETFVMRELPAEKVNNLVTRHAMVSVRTLRFGGAGDGESNTKMEVWVAPIPLRGCEERFVATSAVHPAVVSSNGVAITYELRGDVEKVRKLLSGLVLRAKYYEGSRVVLTHAVKEHTVSILDEKLFKVPASYKKVSPADLNSAQNTSAFQAMLKSAVERTNTAPSETPSAETPHSVAPNPEPPNPEATSPEASTPEAPTPEAPKGDSSAGAGPSVERP